MAEYLVIVHIDPDWILKRGTTFTAPEEILVTDDGAPVDLTAEDWSASMQVRRSETSEEVLATFDLGPSLADGVVAPKLTAAQTSELPAPAVVVADLRVEGPDLVSATRTLYLQVLPEVTRS